MLAEIMEDVGAHDPDDGARRRVEAIDEAEQVRILALADADEDPVAHHQRSAPAGRGRIGVGRVEALDRLVLAQVAIAQVGHPDEAEIALVEAVELGVEADEIDEAADHRRGAAHPAKAVRIALVGLDLPGVGGGDRPRGEVDLLEHSPEQADLLERIGEADIDRAVAHRRHREDRPAEAQRVEDAEAVRGQHLGVDRASGRVAAMVVIAVIHPPSAGLGHRFSAPSVSRPVRSATS